MRWDWRGRRMIKGVYRGRVVCYNDFRLELTKKDSSIEILKTSDNLENILDYFQFCKMNKKIFAINVSQLRVVKIIKIENTSIYSKFIISGDEFR